MSTSHLIQRQMNFARYVHNCTKPSAVLWQDLTNLLLKHCRNLGVTYKDPCVFTSFLNSVFTASFFFFWSPLNFIFSAFFEAYFSSCFSSQLMHYLLYLSKGIFQKSRVLFPVSGNSTSVPVLDSARQKYSTKSYCDNHSLCQLLSAWPKVPSLRDLL